MPRSRIVMPVFAFPDGDAYFERIIPSEKVPRPSFCMPTSDISGSKDQVLDVLTRAIAKASITREYQISCYQPQIIHCNVVVVPKRTQIDREAKVKLMQSFNRAQRSLQRQGYVLKANQEIWQSAIRELARPCLDGSSIDLSRRISESRKRIKQYRKAIEWEEKMEAEQRKKELAANEENTKKPIKQEEPLKKAEPSVKAAPKPAEQPTFKIEDYERPAAMAKLASILEESRKSREAAQRAKADPRAELKAARLKVRMDVNKRVSQICSAKSQVFQVIRELLNICNQAWQKHGSDLLHYCLDLIALKMMEQAETQIAIHTPSAFPTAQVCVDLGGIQPVFMSVLLSHIFERCIYAVPRYIPRQPGQTEAAYRLALGYAREDEPEQAYRDRMCGIVALYGAIMQTRPMRKGLPHTHDLGHAWTWLASILNMTPRPITPPILCSFLEVAGYEISQRYPKDFPSLMEYLQSVYIPRLPAECVAAQTRLELYLEEVRKRKFTPGPPEGSILD